MEFWGGGTHSLAPAFTLAEVLVTLGIIGVISAMTLPTLVKNHQRQVYVTQLHKVVNEVSQALELYKNDNNAVGLLETPLRNNPAGLRDFVLRYFKVAKDCGTKYAPCYADTIKELDGSQEYMVKNNQCNIVFTLASGAAICMDVAQNQDGYSYEDEDGNIVNVAGVNAKDVLYMEVDINGPKGPNLIGRDIIMGIGVSSDGQLYPENDDSYFAQIIDAGWKMEY